MLASMNEVSKYFADRLVFKQVNVSIEDGDRIGLVGANGIGKSTLLNVLCGRLALDEGAVTLTSGVTIGILEQNSGLDRDNTIYAEMRSVFTELLETEASLRKMEDAMAAAPVHDAAYEAMCEEYSRLSSWFDARGGWQIDVRIKTILNGMGFEDHDWELSIAALSGGEKTRLALAKLLLEEPGLLILDEPTNHLDFRTLMWLEDYLQNYRGGLLVVSHDRYFLDKMVRKIWEIEHNTVVAYPGNYTKYKQLREERYKRMQKEYEIQQNRINSMKDYAARNIVRATTSNMAKSRLHQLEHIEVLDKPVDIQPTPHFRFTFERNPVKDLLTVKNLTLAVGEPEEQIVLSQDIGFEVKRGEKIALIGPNGVGKSTLLKTLLGYLPVVSNADSRRGEIYWGDKVSLSYYEQENLTLHRDKTALDELWDRFPRLAPYEARGILGQVLISGENAFKPIGVLSGGERARVALAVLMTEHSNTLILDEPTNHLDLQSKEELEKALVEFEGTLIFVSHDRYFLNTIPTKIIELHKSGLTVYNGNFDYYLEEQRKQEVAIAEEAARQPVPAKPVSEGAKAAFRSKQERAEQTKRRTRLRELESAIAESETRIAALEAEIAAPETGADYERLTALCAELEEAKATHDICFAEWMELSEEDI